MSRRPVAPPPLTLTPPTPADRLITLLDALRATLDAGDALARVGSLYDPAPEADAWYHAAADLLAALGLAHHDLKPQPDPAPEAKTPAEPGQIWLHSGKTWNVLHPADRVRSPIHLSDLSHSLARQCRYTGHTDRHYSVAEHCVRCSEIVDPDLAWVALLHDAAEAYTGDLSAPLKALLPDFRALERRVERALFRRFGMPWQIPLAVRRADKVLMLTEMRDLCGGYDARRRLPKEDRWLEPLPLRIEPWDYEQARFEFEHAYTDLLDRGYGRDPNEV